MPVAGTCATCFPIHAVVCDSGSQKDDRGERGRLAESSASGEMTIHFRGVSKRHGETWAVRDVTLEIARGELVAIVGESGSGKTTLLKMVNRLHAPDGGTVLVDGRDVAREDPVALRRTIGYVIQQVGLLPHLTVGDNVGTVPRLLGWPREQIAARTDELLD